MASRRAALSTARTFCCLGSAAVERPTLRVVELTKLLPSVACRYVNNTDFYQPSNPSVPASDQFDCCAKCTADAGCNAFAFVLSDKTCWYVSASWRIRSRARVAPPVEQCATLPLCPHAHLCVASTLSVVVETAGSSPTTLARGPLTASFPGVARRRPQRLVDGQPSPTMARRTQLQRCRLPQVLISSSWSLRRTHLRVLTVARSSCHRGR